MNKMKELWDSKKNLIFEGIGNDLVNELVRVAPVDSGNLRNSIRYEVDGNGLNIIGPEYMYYVEFGTRPHEIRPKSKSSLKWDGGSGAVFAKVVKHPGTEPNPFIRRTINTKLRNIVYRNIQRHLQ